MFHSDRKVFGCKKSYISNFCDSRVILIYEYRCTQLHVLQLGCIFFYFEDRYVSQVLNYTGVLISFLYFSLVCEFIDLNETEYTINKNTLNM